MEVLENTENDLQIDHRTIDCYVITLTNEVQKLRTQYATNPLNMGMFMNLPWAVINALNDIEVGAVISSLTMLWSGVLWMTPNVR